VTVKKEGCSTNTAGPDGRRKYASDNHRLALRLPALPMPDPTDAASDTGTDIDTDSDTDSDTEVIVAEHVKPYIYETPTSRALHFSICEIQSRMDLRKPDALELEYTRTMMAFMLFKPLPAHIGMIGLGGGSLVKFCSRHLPDTRLTVVEINPHVIALRNDFQIPPDDARLQVICADGAQFVRDPPERIDALLVDGFDTFGLPDELSSQRFYDDCFEALLPDGIMVANLHFGHPEYALQLERIGRAFGQSVLPVADSHGSNSVVFAVKGDALERQPASPVRRPAGLLPGGWTPLKPSFSRVASALQKQRMQDA